MTRYVGLEVDHDAITSRFRGREGDSTPDLSLTFAGCQGMSLESDNDPEGSGRCEFTEFRSLFVAEVGEMVSTFDVSLHDLRIVVSTTVVEARYDRSG